MLSGAIARFNSTSEFARVIWYHSRNHPSLSNFAIRIASFLLSLDARIGPVVSSHHFEAALLEPVRGFHGDFFGMLGRHSITFSVPIRERLFRIVERLSIDIGEIGRVVRAHPAAILVMADIRKRKTKSRVACKIPTLVAVKVSFVDLTRSEERKMRIYEEQCMAARTS
jgi:hypothetical protein